MFQKGNQLAKGRPKLSLTKPELLLPAIFAKGSVNWSNDFLKLYRIMRERDLTTPERNLLAFFNQFMPYLCTKVQLKEIMGQASVTTPADSAAQAKQTSKLLQALENENATRPSTQS